MQVMDRDGNYYIHEIPINTISNAISQSDGTYLTFENGSQPIGNDVGLNPKKP